MVKKKVTAILTAVAMSFLLLPATGLPVQVWAEETAQTENRGYSLTFQTDIEDGSAFTLSGQESGSVVDLSIFTPVKENYAFKGWCEDEALTKPITSVTMVDNVTVYAKWESTVINIINIVDGNTDGSVSSVSTDEENGIVTKTEEIDYPDETFRSIITVTKEDGSGEVTDTLFDKNGVAKEITFSDTENGTVTRKFSYQLKGSQATVVTIKKTFGTGIAIPEKIKDMDGNSYKVTGVGKDACRKNTKIKTLVIGKNIESIEATAFQGCNNLSTIRMSSKIKKIGSNAFQGIGNGANFKIKASQANYEKIVKLLKASGCKKVKYQKF